MVKDGSRSERVLEEPESGVAGGRPIPRGVLVREMGEWDGEIGVSSNEPTVEISETEEGLHILDLPGRGPVLDDLDL